MSEIAQAVAEVETKKPNHRFMANQKSVLLDQKLTVDEMQTIMTHYHRVNRPVTKSGVEQIASDLKNNLWEGETGNVIKFDRDGNLIDGQHRMLAHIAANTPLVVDVFYGLPTKAILFTDRSKSRNMAVNSVLLEHITDGTIPTKSDFTSNKLRLSVAKEALKHSGLKKPTDQNIRQYAVDHKDALDFALVPLENESARRPGYLSALVLYFQRDAAKAKEFRDGVGGLGIGLDDGPIARLRIFLNKPSIGGSQMKHDHWRTVGAIHAFHFGEALTVIPPMKRDWDF